MIYPSIDRLLNIVDSKYKLVHIAADRAKVMKEYKHTIGYIVVFSAAFYTFLYNKKLDKMEKEN